MKNNRCGDEGRRSKTEEHMGGIVVSDDKEAIDDEKFVEIRLFDGTITEPRGLKRSVVAVRMRSLIELNFKVGALSYSLDHCCSFKPKYHGHDTQEIKIAFALISMKVTWSTLFL
uniref:DUF6598 domain-containing protein n=1 Tax=Oryza punctata TaxID=4537 RepID=A0A0E0LP63_ORYPU